MAWENSRRRRHWFPRVRSRGKSPDLGPASDWLKQISIAVRPIKSTTQIWVVIRSQYGISACAPHKSFNSQRNIGVAKCRLFSYATHLTATLWLVRVRQLCVTLVKSGYASASDSQSRPGKSRRHWGCAWDLVSVVSNCTVGQFYFYCLLRGCEGNWVKIRPSKQSHGVIGHLHDDVILLLQPEPCKVLLSCVNKGFCFVNLAGITKFKYERRNGKDSGRSSKMRTMFKLAWVSGVTGGKGRD